PVGLLLAGAHLHFSALSLHDALPISFDWDTIAASIRKTNAVLIVEQGAQGTSYGGWLADEIQRRYFDWLDQPIVRVTGGEASPSISKVLEQAAIASVDNIVARLEQMRIAMGANYWQALTECPH